MKIEYMVNLCNYHFFTVWASVDLILEELIHIDLKFEYVM